MISTFQKEIPTESKWRDEHHLTLNGVTIDVYKLINLTKESPFSELEIKAFTEDLENKCWIDGNGDKISPISVLKAIENTDGVIEECLKKNPELTEHLRKIISVNPIHPIIIFENHVLDGMHRLIRALVDGKDTVPVQILDEIPEEAVVNK